MGSIQMDYVTTKDGVEQVWLLVSLEISTAA